MKYLCSANWFLTFESICGWRLKCNYSNESYWAVLCCGTVYCAAVQGGSNLRVWTKSAFLNVTIQIKTSSATFSCDAVYYFITLVLFCIWMVLLITLYWGTKFFLILRGTRTKSYDHWNESFGFCVWLNFSRTLLFVLLSTVFPVLSCVYEPNFLSQKHLRERSGHSALKLKRCDHFCNGCFKKDGKKTNSKLNGIFND